MIQPGMLYRRPASRRSLPLQAGALLAVLAAACAQRRDSPALLRLEPPRPLDELARAAAEALAPEPERLTLEGANGLERLGARLEREDWVAAARRRFEQRLADPAPLGPAEAEAFRERWTEVDHDPRWRARLLAEGRPAEATPPDLESAAGALEEALRSGDPNALLHSWGRAHAWFGHVWMDAGRAIASFDGLGCRRGEAEVAGALHPGWWLSDTLGIARPFTVRRAGDHASLRWIAAGGETFVPDHLPAEGHAH